MPSQCKLNMCVPQCCQTPVTSSNLLRSLGSLAVRHGTAVLHGGWQREGMTVWECGGGFQVPPHPLQQLSGQKSLVITAPKGLVLAQKAGFLLWRDKHSDSPLVSGMKKQVWPKDVQNKVGEPGAYSSG